MLNFGIGELLIIGLLVVLLFGGRRLPQLGQALGQAISNFKKEIKKDNEGTEETKKLS